MYMTSSNATKANKSSPIFIGHVAINCSVCSVISLSSPRDDHLGEKIWISFSPTITSTKMTSVKRTDKTDRGGGKSCRKEVRAAHT